MDNTADAFDGMVYSVGGFDSGLTFLDDLYRLRPSHRHVESDRLDERREGEAGSCVRRRPALCGRWLGHHRQPVRSWRSTTRRATLVTGRRCARRLCGGFAVALDGQLYVIGGCQDPRCGATDVLRLRPSRRQLVAGGAVPRADLVDALRGDRRLDLLRRRCQRLGRRELQRAMSTTRPPTAGRRSPTFRRRSGAAASWPPTTCCWCRAG